jgi:hypothetical protein
LVRKPPRADPDLLERFRHEITTGVAALMHA